jgi:hypothetical protein
VQYRVGSGGAWTDWLSDTSLTQETFSPFDPVPLIGEQTYYFRCRARDNAGNVEPYPAGDGDTQTTVHLRRILLPLIKRDAP